MRSLAIPSRATRHHFVVASGPDHLIHHLTGVVPVWAVRPILLQPGTQRAITPRHCTRDFAFDAYAPAWHGTTVERSEGHNKRIDRHRPPTPLRSSTLATMSCYDAPLFVKHCRSCLDDCATTVAAPLGA